MSVHCTKIKSGAGGVEISGEFSQGKKNAGSGRRLKSRSLGWEPSLTTITHMTSVLATQTACRRDLISLDSCHNRLVVGYHWGGIGAVDNRRR